MSFFGFVNLQDPLILYSEEFPTWHAYGRGQFGGPLLVESNNVPFLGSHELTTDLPPEDRTNYHGATVEDAATPLAPDGTTVYQSVWRFMKTGPPELPQSQSGELNSNQWQITLSTFNNYSYQVQTTTNLTSGRSPAGPPVAGNGTTTNLDFIPVSGSQFFRVLVQY